MKKYNTPHRSRVIKTRLTVEEYAEFSERVSLCKMSQAEFIRQALTKSRIELLIGQSSTEGERKRRARRALQEQKALPEAVADKRPPYGADICPPEIEKEIDIELEIKREGEIKPGQTTRAPFGRYKNVFLSEKELAELQTELPGKWEYYINRLSGYIASSGKKYKNHAATIRRWAADDEAKKAPKQKIPDYSYREGESL